MVSIRRRKHLLARIKLEATTCAENQEALSDLPFFQDGTPPALKGDFRDKDLKRRKLHRRRKPGTDSQEPCALRGVYLKNSKWQAAIKVGKKQVHLGTVNTREEAAHLYDRAAYMCGREPNFALPEEEKQELQSFEWEEFLAITRRAIAQKKMENKLVAQNKRRELNLTLRVPAAPSTPVPGSPLASAPSSSPPATPSKSVADQPTEAGRTPSPATEKPLLKDAPNSETGVAPTLTMPMAPPTPVSLPDAPAAASPVAVGTVAAASGAEA